MELTNAESEEGQEGDGVAAQAPVKVALLRRGLVLHGCVVALKTVVRIAKLPPCAFAGRVGVSELGAADARPPEVTYAGKAPCPRIASPLFIYLQLSCVFFSIVIAQLCSVRIHNGGTHHPPRTLIRYMHCLAAAR